MVFTFFVGGKHYPEAPWLCAWFELKVTRNLESPANKCKRATALVYSTQLTKSAPT